MRMVMVLLALLFGASWAGSDTKNVDKTVPLAATGSVTLETHNGSIDVHTWDRPQVEIHARIEAAGASAENLRRLEATTVEVASTSDSVRITSKYPDVVWSWFGENPSISYTITAPRTTRWTIRDHNASTVVRDLSAALNVGTHNGSLRVMNLDGSLEVDSHNGTITADFASFHGANITTHNGWAELALPSTSKFDLRANTHTRVQFDFPLLTRALGGRYGALEGTVNGGGSGLRFSSHNGHLRVRAR